jgi:predicted HTH domain antitoxin
MSRTIEITLPDCLEISHDEIKMILAAKLFDMGELSSGQAAEIAGISRRQFLETVGKYGVSIFQYSTDELKQDLARLQPNRSCAEQSRTDDERKPSAKGTT